jgi:hypothetical protein
MSIALHLSTREFRSLRREGHRLVGRSCPCVYVALPDGPPERKLLEQARIDVSLCSGNLLVLGQPAIDLARSLKLPCLTPFECNRLPPGDTLARQVVAAMIDAVMPSRVPVEYRCVLSVPGEYRLNSRETDVAPRCFEDRPRDIRTSTAATLAHFVELKGYATSIVSSSYALGLSELGRDRMTGISLHFDASESQASLLLQGKEVVHAGISRGEDTLLDEWARRRRLFIWDHEGHCYLNQMAVREWKDRSLPSLIAPQDDGARIWKDLVAALVAELMDQFITVLARVPGIRQKTNRLPAVFAGGITNTPGFALLLGEVLARYSDELSAVTVRPAADPHYATARGLLIYAEGIADDADENARPLSRVG